MSWLREILSNDPDALSYRRGTGLVAFFVFLIGHFVIMFYAKVVTNTPLFEHSQEWLAIMVMAMVAGITVDRFARRGSSSGQGRLIVDGDAGESSLVDPAPAPSKKKSEQPQAMIFKSPQVSKAAIKGSKQEKTPAKKAIPKKTAQTPKTKSANGTPLKTSSGAQQRKSTATKSSTARPRK